MYPNQVFENLLFKGIRNRILETSCFKVFKLYITDKENLVFKRIENQTFIKTNPQLLRQVSIVKSFNFMDIKLYGFIENYIFVVARMYMYI